MDHKDFDDIIKNKLDGIEPSFDASHWDMLEDQLDEFEIGQPETEQTILDATVFDKLHRYEVPYQPEHWALLSERIGIEFHLRGKIVRYKLLELSLMLLLFFTFYNLLPTSNSAFAPQATLATTTISSEQITEEQAVTTTSNTIDNKTKTEQDNPIFNSTNTHFKQSTFISTGASSSPHEVSNAASNTDTSVEDDVEAPVTFSTPNQEQQNTKFVLPLLPNTRNNRLSLLRDDAEMSIPLSVQESPLVETLLFAPAKGDATDVALGLPITPAANADRGIRIGMYASFDYNQVFTASNEAAFDRFSRAGFGYGGGLSVGFPMGRWELETGFMYSAKQYAPWILELQGDFRDGYSGVGLKNTELNLISVPLNLRYDVHRQKNWRFYVLAGASIHVAFQANYYTGDAADLFNKNLPEPRNSLANGRSTFDQDNLSKGWFEGGTFEENVYLTGSVGVGVEHYLSTGWSIFAQPTYYRSINYFRHGIGPNRDRIHTISLLMGVKVKI
ncbi:MAG: outer membrane beta-barrel protein [Bacteroidota bacterium]